VKGILPLLGKLHKRTVRITTMEEVEELFPGFKAFLDATEQEIPRPGDKAREGPTIVEEEASHG
jgi:hypothetical protein